MDSLTGSTTAAKIFSVFRPNLHAAGNNTHSAAQANAPDKVQCEGAVFSDGTTVIQWCTTPSTAVFRSFDEFMRVHGHPEYGTILKWSSPHALPSVATILNPHPNTTPHPNTNPAALTVVGLCGLLGAGKDTVADYLGELGFRRASFAGLLKDVVAQAFGWPRDLLEGRTAESRAWREQVDADWSGTLGKPGLTPRAVLQQWGTDVVRNHFHPEFWVKALKRRILQGEFGSRVVVTDCRFPNEIAMVKRDLGGQVWRIQRGPAPELLLHEGASKVECDHVGPAVGAGGETANAAGDGGETADGAGCLPHESEWAWMGFEDVTLHNNGTLEELRAKVSASAASWTIV